MLTARQQRFVEEYLVLANGYRAALKAGYAPRCARQTASKLLRLPQVAAAIRAEQEARGERLRVTADRVIAELARLAFADIGRLAEWREGDLVLRPSEEVSADDRAAVAAIVRGKGAEAPVRLRLHDKLRALNSLARHLGLFRRLGPPPIQPIHQRPPGEKPAREILRERLEALAAESRREKEAAEKAAAGEKE